MTHSTCAATTGRSRAGIRLQCGKRRGRVIAADMTKEVTFAPVEGPINERIDEAYRAKYRGSTYLKPMIGARARSATIKIMPGNIARP